MQSFLKNYATALVVAIFLAIAVTGLMMFFGVAAHDVHDLHEWFGIIFVVAAVLHIAWNWRPLTVRLRQTQAVAVIAMVVVVAGGLIGYTQFKPGDGGEGGGVRRVFTQLGKAPIFALAPALGTTADKAMARLKARGVTVSGPDQSLADIARAQGKDVPALFGAVMGSGERR